MCFCRLAAAQEAAAQQRSVRDCSPAPGHSMAPHSQQPPAGAKGPTSLFILSEDNPIRRYTRFIIEWPYPLLHSECCSCPVVQNTVSRNGRSFSWLRNVRLVWNRCHYRVPKSPSHTQPFHTFTSYSNKTHFNIIFLNKPNFPSDILCFSFISKSFCAFLIFVMRGTRPACHPPRFGDPKHIS